MPTSNDPPVQYIFIEPEKSPLPSATSLESTEEYKRLQNTFVNKPQKERNVANPNPRQPELLTEMKVSGIQMKTQS